VADVRVRRLVFALAVIALLAAMAFLALSIVEHRDAEDDRTQVQRELITARRGQSADAEDLQRAHDAVASVRDQLAAVGKGAVAVADLDQQDFAAVTAALQAGQAGDRSTYNAAADQRATLDAQHDTAVEQLRQQVNAIITALDGLS
jgi:hypothetical protein